MQITPATILLGEPAWVDVSVTNRSSEALRVDMGTSCFGAKELTIRVPGAEAYDRDPKRCGAGMAGSCISQGPIKIEPGATFTRRYVLRGDFRIVRAGAYTVFFDKDFPYGPDLGGTFGGKAQNFPHLTESQHARTQKTLTVLPADHNRLLQIERAEAQEMAAPLPSLPIPPNASIDVVRQVSEESNQLRRDAVETKSAIASGLTDDPTAGMEPIFSAWLEQNNTTAADWGQRALAHLNTPSSRKILARQAASTDKPQDINFQIHRWEAIDALSKMGDKSYVPLLEKLARDPYHDVQRLSVRGLGLLGGEKELPLLNTIALNAKTMTDRQDAVMAMGDTGSPRAVPLLIELYTLPGSDESTSEYALWTLTHHHVQPPYARMLTPQEGKIAWQNWWMKNEHTARIYGPYDCADVKDAFGTMPTGSVLRRRVRPHWTDAAQHDTDTHDDNL
jgi:hypothetical protein